MSDDRMNREQPRTAPVGLEEGDEYKTPFGTIEIQSVDGDEYEIHDPRTGEETWLDFDDLLAIMQANVYSK